MQFLFSKLKPRRKSPRFPFRVTTLVATRDFPPQSRLTSRSPLNVPSPIDGDTLGSSERVRRDHGLDGKFILIKLKLIVKKLNPTFVIKSL